MGAKMRTDSDASESWMSSWRFVILLTRSPSPISILKVVTRGPAVQPETRLVRPNSSSVDCRRRAVRSSSASVLAELAELGLLERSESGGNVKSSDASPGRDGESGAAATRLRDPLPGFGFAGEAASFVFLYAPTSAPALAAVSIRNDGTAVAGAVSAGDLASPSSKGSSQMVGSAEDDSTSPEAAAVSAGASSSLTPATGMTPPAGRSSSMSSLG